MQPPKRQIVVSRAALQQSRVKHADGAFAGKEESIKIPKLPGMPEKLKATFFPDEPAEPAQVVEPKPIKFRIIHNGRFFETFFGGALGLFILYLAALNFLTGRFFWAFALCATAIFIFNRCGGYYECNRCRGRVHGKALVCQHCNAEF